MEPLPEGTKELMITAFGEVIPRFIEEIDIDSKTYEVHTRQSTDTPLGVGFRLLCASQDFANSATVSIFVDIVQEPGEEPSE